MSTPTPAQELTQPCAWSDGEPYAGKSYILQTTEGPEVVSEPAFRLSATVARDLADNLARLEKRVAQLEEKLEAPVAIEPDSGDDDKQPAAKAAPKK